MVIRESGLSGGQTRYKTRLGEVVWSTPAAGVVLVRYQGHAEVALYDPISQEMEAQLSRFSKLHLFVDFEELASYDTEFRTRWTEWFRRNRSNLLDAHVLQGSALVKMGIQLVNLFVGELFSLLVEREPFEKKLEQAVRAAGGSSVEQRGP